MAGDNVLRVTVVLDDDPTVLLLSDFVDVCLTWDGPSAAETRCPWLEGSGLHTLRTVDGVTVVAGTWKVLIRLGQVPVFGLQSHPVSENRQNK